MPVRTIAFFALESVENRPVFDLSAAVSPINQLSEADWPMDTPNYKMGVLVDQTPTTNRPAHLRVLRLRDDLPHVLSPQRRIRALGVDPGDTLTEFTHVAIWSDGYVAAASSRDAPPATRLSEYFSVASQQTCTLHQLYDPSVVRRFRAMKKGLRSAEMKVRLQSSEIQQALDDDQLTGFKAFAAAGKDADAVTMTVRLSIDRSRGAELDSSVHDMVERLTAYDTFVDSLVVRGEDRDGNAETLNLKKERIVSEISYSTTAGNGAIYRLLATARQEVEERIGGFDRAARLD